MSANDVDAIPDPAVPETAAVQAAIETLARWLRSGGTLVRPVDADGAPALRGASEPTPEPTRAPEPGPSPVPAPSPEPPLTPWPDPEPDPAPDPAPRPAPDPVPGPAPGRGPALPPGPAAPPDAPCPYCRGPADPVAVRRWAREHGFRVAERGRLPTAIVAAYVAAHRHA
jgi:outer membrane biosynthesis protein TonB